MGTIQTDIEARLAEREPDVEVLLAELKGDNVELFIDHPEGVTLELCERHMAPKYRQLIIDAAATKQVHHLRSPDEIRGFLDAVANKKGPAVASPFRIQKRDQTE